jgi:phage-related minor tail protein
MANWKLVKNVMTATPRVAMAVPVVRLAVKHLSILLILSLISTPLARWLALVLLMVARLPMNGAVSVALVENQAVVMEFVMTAPMLFLLALLKPTLIVLGIVRQLNLQSPHQ